MNYLRNNPHFKKALTDLEERVRRNPKTIDTDPDATTIPIQKGCALCWKLLNHCPYPMNVYARQLIERVLPPTRALCENEDMYRKVRTTTHSFFLFVKMFSIQELTRWIKRDQQYDAVLYYWLYQEVCCLLIYSSLNRKSRLKWIFKSIIENTCKTSKTTAWT